MFFFCKKNKQKFKFFSLYCTIYNRYHRKATASLDWDGKDKQASPYFKSEIKSGSSSYIKRDQTFEGNFLGAPKNSGKDFHTAAQVHQFDYPDSCRVNDRKALYSNPKYPWIIGIYRYRICLHMPNRPDVANIRFPAGTAPGLYNFTCCCCC